MKSAFAKGVSNGIPIALGYFSVSFGFGISAVNMGISALNAFIISLTNLTSAGQLMGITVIAAGGTLLEMAATQLVINLRYSLMGITLSQKLSDKFNTFHRMCVAFGITDEIFAVAVSRHGKIEPSYMYGLISVAMLGWTSGTVAGSVANMLLPEALAVAMGIMLYGMFIAIIVPPARKSVKVLTVILISAGISAVFYYFVPSVPSGFAIIISAVVAAVAGALLFPVEDEKETEAEEQ